MSARYLVRALKFRCGDESGYDWPGSDEPFWIFSTTDGNGNATSIKSQTFGDVDSGDVRSFRNENNRNVIWPAQGDSRGAAGPIALSIQLWESDQGDSESIRKKTETALSIAAATGVASWAAAVPPVVRDAIAQFAGHDLMGSNTLLITELQLNRHLPNVGDSFTRKDHYGGSGGDIPWTVAGGPDYDLWLQVVRVA
jgi:hypothetical protein